MKLNGEPNYSFMQFQLPQFLQNANTYYISGKLPSKWYRKQISTWQKTNLDFSCYINLQVKSIRALKIRCWNCFFKVQHTSWLIGSGKHFWNRTLEVYKIRSQTDKWNVMKIKIKCERKQEEKERNDTVETVR